MVADINWSKIKIAGCNAGQNKNINIAGIRAIMLIQIYGTACLINVNGHIESVMEVSQRV